jgi:hypothetical protein
MRFRLSNLNEKKGDKENRDDARVRRRDLRRAQTGESFGPRSPTGEEGEPPDDRVYVDRFCRRNGEACAATSPQTSL